MPIRCVRCAAGGIRARVTVRVGRYEADRARAGERRRSRCPALVPCASPSQRAIGSPTILPIVMPGFSDANGSWKMIWHFAAQPPQRRACAMRDVLAWIEDAAVRRIDQTEAAGGPSVDFAAARFADDREGLARLHSANDTSVDLHTTVGVA